MPKGFIYLTLINKNKTPRSIKPLPTPHEEVIKNKKYYYVVSSGLYL